MVFVQVGVLIGGFTSKTTVAVFWITVPVVTVDFGSTVKNTLPPPHQGEGNRQSDQLAADSSRGRGIGRSM